MKQEEQKQQQACGLYVAPALEVVHLQVERGFADSGVERGLGLDNTSLVLSESDDNVEDRLDVGSFGAGLSEW